MKYFVVTVRSKPGDSTCYYPEGYEGICQVTVGDKYYHENGSFKRLHIIPDELALNILRPDIVEVPEAEALRICSLDEPELAITDEATIRLIEIKTKLGQTLTEKELKAINPDDATPGIVRRKHLGHRIAELKDKEIKGEFKKERYA